MKTEVTSLSTVRKKLSIEVPAEDVAAVLDFLLRKHRKQVKVPGFRPGKAPLDVVRARLGHELEHEAAEAIVEEFGREAFRQEGLKPVWFDVELPEGVDHIPHPTEGQPFAFTLAVETYPDFEPKDYTALEVARPSADVDVEEVQKELEAMRQSRAKLVDVAERGSATDDWVGAEIGAREGEAEIMPPTFRVVRIGGADTPAEFSANLSGRSVGDEFSFEVSHPAEFGDPTFAGKTVVYSGKVVAVKRPEVPEWSDELAREFGNGVADYADLREKVKESLGRRKQYEADQEARRRLLERILENNPFEVPGSLVDEELRDRLNRIGRNLASQGIDPEQAGVDWKTVVEEERGRAERAVREGIVLDRIAEREAGVVVTQADIDAYIAAMARDMREPVGKVRQMLKERSRMSLLQAEVRRNKCLDWLFGQAHIN